MAHLSGRGGFVAIACPVRELIHSFTSQAKASSRVSKAGKSRREKLLRFLANASGKCFAPTHAVFLIKGLSKTAVSFITRSASSSNDAPVKSESIKTELHGRGWSQAREVLRRSLAPEPPSSLIGPPGESVCPDE
jgi:hypothetical protein